MPDRDDMKSILEACRRTGPMDESLVRGTAESSSSNSEEYHADAMRGTNYMQFSYDENGNNDNEILNEEHILMNELLIKRIYNRLKSHPSLLTLTL